MFFGQVATAICPKSVGIFRTNAQPVATQADWNRCVHPKLFWASLNLTSYLCLSLAQAFARVSEMEVADAFADRENGFRRSAGHHPAAAGPRFVEIGSRTGYRSESDGISDGTGDSIWLVIIRITATYVLNSTPSPAPLFPKINRTKWSPSAQWIFPPAR